MCTFVLVASTVRLYWSHQAHCVAVSYSRRARHANANASGDTAAAAAAPPPPSHAAESGMCAQRKGGGVSRSEGEWDLPERVDTAAAAAAPPPSSHAADLEALVQEVRTLLALLVQKYKY